MRLLRIEEAKSADRNEEQKESGKTKKDDLTG